MADEIDKLKIEKMKKLCSTRPVIYSDLDHLKKGSTGYLHSLGYSDGEIAATLELDVTEVKNNLKGTGFALDLRKIGRFAEDLPGNIGDIVSIRIPSLSPDAISVVASARVIQCIPRSESCGLVVELMEDVESTYPMIGNKKKGDEVVVPLEWYLC